MVVITKTVENPVSKAVWQILIRYGSLREFRGAAPVIKYDKYERGIEVLIRLEERLAVEVIRRIRLASAIPTENANHMRDAYIEAPIPFIFFGSRATFR